MNNDHHPDPEHDWHKYARGFGPVRQLTRCVN